MSQVQAFVDGFLTPSYELLKDQSFAIRTAGVLVLFLGVWSFASLMLSLCRAFMALIRPLWPHNIKKYGQWGVVTGATDGIGLAVACELARKGLNVYLLSRTPDRLREAAVQVASAGKKHNVEVKIYPIDFSSTDPRLYDNLRMALDGLDIGVLINNVGMSYPHPMYMYELEAATITGMIELNVQAATQLTHMVLPGMVERKRGAVVNIGSGAGKMSVGNPMLAVYSGTKAYLDAFSKSLFYELKGKGIHVQCQSPFLVTSKLSKIRRSSLTIPTPAAFAKWSVAAIGSGPSVVPYWSHALQYWLSELLPHWMSARLLLGMHASLRARAMKKKAGKSQ